MCTKKTKKLTYLICVISLIGLFSNQFEARASLDPNIKWVPFVSQAPSGALFTVLPKATDNTGNTIDSDIPGMYVQDVNVEGQIYQMLKIPNTKHSLEIGKPQVPVIRKYLEVPYSASIATVEIIYSDYSEFLCYNVYPAQEPLPDIDINEVPEFTIDWTTYSTDEFYPSSIALAEEPIMMRGHRIIPITLFPVQVNPVTRTLRGYSKIEVRLNYDFPAQIEGIEGAYESEMFEGLCEPFILNYKSPDRYMTRKIGAKSKAAGTGADYLIICPNDFNTPAESLAEWKRKKGYKTKVVTTATTGTTAAQIEQYIQNAYNSWDPPPTYVLLLGDSEFIPADYRTVHPSSTHGNHKTATDLYYSTLSGSDYFPDVFLGRLSVDTEAEATTVIDKILDYEKDPNTDASLYSNASVCAYFQDYGNDGYEDRRFVLTSEEIRNHLLGKGYTVERIYCAENNRTPTNYNNGDYDDGIALPAGLLRPGFAWNGGSADITAAFNAGRFIINHRDHGGSENCWCRDPRGNYWCSTEGWGDPYFTTAEVSGLTNGDRLPVVFSINCMTGWFDGEIDQTDDPALTRSRESLCEEMLRHPDGGAVAVIGATRISYSGHNDDLAKGFYDAIWPDFISPKQNAIYELGQVLNYGKIYMYLQTWWGHELTEFEEFHLFGDPEMSIRTDQPKALTVTHPSEIKTGISQSIQVNVKHGVNPVTYARIGLYKEDEVHTYGYTNVAGNKSFNVTASTAGTLYITVTEVNSVAYEGTITVTNVPASITLTPDSNTVGSSFNISGSNFFASETVNIDFGSTFLGTAFTAGDGSFSKNFNVPAEPDGPANVVAKGQTSGKTAVAIFTVVPPAPPPDPYIYHQWNSSTWHLTPGSGDPIWNNPCIQLYEVATNNPVASGNLKIGTPYRVEATIYNTATVVANGAQVTFEWSDLGTGTPVGGWRFIGTDDVNVPASPGTVIASAIWTPIQTGHCCINVDVYHASDSDMSNNHGWENTQVKPISSPAEIPFRVYNTTESRALVCLEVTQSDPYEPELYDVWETRITRPYPQVLEPNDYQIATLRVMAPQWAYEGQTRVLSVTARVNGEVIGGIDFEVIKQPAVTAHNPSPTDGAEDAGPNVILSWKPGQDAQWHDVYFGTNWDDVNDANIMEPGSVYMGRQEPNYYPEFGNLELDYGSTHYWRIDEANTIQPDNPVKGQVWSFSVADGKASMPSPLDGASDICTDVVLSWLPGIYATSHDVYFGTDWDDVNDGSGDTPKGNQTGTTWDPCGLDYSVTYYWRIDGRNGPQEWKGDVWTFTVTDYIVENNFEDYDNQGIVWPYERGDPPPSGSMWEKWVDGYQQKDSGSLIYGAYASEDPLEVHGGAQAMQFDYDNDGNVCTPDGGGGQYCYTTPYYSQVTYVPTVQDWTNLAMMSIWFRGTKGNARDELYIKLSDGVNEDAIKYTGLDSKKTYLGTAPDVNAILSENWQQWIINLDWFNTVDLSNVTELTLGIGDINDAEQRGSGTVYFDDLRLSEPRCVPNKAKPIADLNFDCIVDLKDVAIIAQEWLLDGCCRADLFHDYTVDFRDYAITAGMIFEEQLWPPELLGHWTFDEGMGSTASDTGSSGNDGTLYGEPNWIPGKVGNYALDFNGVDDYVKTVDSTNGLDFAPGSFSISAWINASTIGGWRTIAEYDRYDIDTGTNWFGIWLTNTGKFHFRVGLDTKDSTQTLTTDKWYLVTATYESLTGEMKLYINGQYDSTGTHSSGFTSGANAKLTIGTRGTEDDEYFDGKIDDVRIYNAALSAEDVQNLFSR